MKKPSNLEFCNCFAVRQAARHLTKLYERHLSGAQLTSAQFSILVALEEAGEMTMSELAKVIGLSVFSEARMPCSRNRLSGCAAI